MDGTNSSLGMSASPASAVGFPQNSDMVQYSPDGSQVLVYSILCSLLQVAFIGLEINVNQRAVVPVLPALTTLHLPRLT
jgi:hypothetical protein